MCEFRYSIYRTSCVRLSSASALSSVFCVSAWCPPQFRYSIYRTSCFPLYSNSTLSSGFCVSALCPPQFRYSIYRASCVRLSSASTLSSVCCVSAPSPPQFRFNIPQDFNHGGRCQIDVHVMCSRKWTKAWVGTKDTLIDCYHYL